MIARHMPIYAESADHADAWLDRGGAFVQLRLRDPIIAPPPAPRRGALDEANVGAVAEISAAVQPIAAAVAAVSALSRNLPEASARAAIADASSAARIRAGAPSEDELEALRRSLPPQKE